MPGIDAPTIEDGAGVCTPWATLADLPEQDYNADPVKLEEVLRFSSDVLYNLSGRVWPGVCIDTIRPCAKREVARMPQWWPVTGWPLTVSTGTRGSWGVCTCNRAARCGCSTLSEIDLGPNVIEVLEVRVDGAAIPAVEYRLDDGRYLVGLTQENGEPRVWPCCQRLDLDDDQPNTWSVTWEHGGMPPVGGRLACAALSHEVATARGLVGGRNDCRLPKRVTTITRQAVTMAVLDPLTLFQKGQTGVPEVDLWLGSLSYGRKQRRGHVTYAGMRRRGRRTG